MGRGGHMRRASRNQTPPPPWKPQQSKAKKKKIISAPPKWEPLNTHWPLLADYFPHKTQINDCIIPGRGGWRGLRLRMNFTIKTGLLRHKLQTMRLILSFTIGYFFPFVDAYFETFSQSSRQSGNVREYAALLLSKAHLQICTQQKDKY